MDHKVNTGKSWRVAALAVLITVAIMASVDATVAYLFTNTDSAENAFVPAVVACVVQDDYLDNITSDVRVKNTGTTEAYVRVAVVINWQDAKDDVIGRTPVEGVDYTVTFNETDWFFYEGFWYCKEPVAVGYVSKVLVEELEPAPLDLPEGYHLSVEFVASAVQSQPDAAVQEAWGVDVEDGTLCIPKTT
jgi:hypothetical protein